MLDHISISHQGGIVLWSRSYTPQAASLVSSPASPVNVLVRDVLVSGRTTDSGEDVLESGGWKMEWTLENELGLVFVVAYHRLLHLSYIPTLLETLKTLFLSLYSPYLTSFVESVKGGVAPAAGEKAIEWDFKKAFEGWDGIFEKVLKKAEEGEAKTNKKPFSRAASSTPKKDLPVKREEAAVLPLSASTPSKPVVEEKPQDADEIAKNLQALKAKLKGSPAGAKKGGAGGGGSKAGSGAASPGGSSGAETPTKRTKSAGSKVMRKWGDSSSSITDSDMAALDFSSPPPPISSSSPPADSANLDELVSKEAMGTRGKDGLYDVADLDAEEEDDDDEEGLDGLGAGKEDDVDAMINKALAKSRLKTAAAAAKSSSSLFKRSPLNPDADEDVAKASSSSSSSTMSSFFSRLTGSKVLTKEDLAPVLEAMEKHLMGKNVAKEIAEKMCDGVEKSLVGKKLAGFGSVKAEVRTSLSQSITRILTPKSSTDILLEIKRKQQLHLSNLALSPATTTTTTSSSSPPTTDPYKMVFIGVNGVGKSTNLSKVCFWLLQNGLRVLIAACDTFRSGAVEQLRVHVRNLGLLGGDKATTGTDGEGEGKGKVELFERGYGKDSAGIAKEAIAYAKTNAFDVVLIDTAGRMQDNEPLMRALSKLVTVNQPDKIVFVGEALVGNEAVDQLSKFDRSLRDFTAAAAGNTAGGGKAGAGGGGGKGGRGVDGMILTKFDTIDDKVGAALSMTYVTGQPILFVGCGQTYTDLRHLRVNHIVQALLKD